MPAALAETRVIGITVEGPRQLGFREFSLPAEPESLTTRTRRSSISPGTEVVAYAPPNNAPPKNVLYPVLKSGYANTAVVTAVRSAESYVQEGDRVSVSTGHRTGDVVPLADEHRYVRLPDNVSDDLGTLAVQMMPIALMGALTAADQWPGGKLSRLEGSLKGQRAVIFGAGPIGLLEGEALRYAGVDHIAIVDGVESRLERAAALGMTPIDFTKSDPVTAIRRLYSEPTIEHGVNYGIGADVVLNTAPSEVALRAAHQSVHDQGTILDMAYYPTPVVVAKGEDFHHRGLTERSGQIGNVPRRQRPEWSRRRLAEVGLEILLDRGEHLRTALFTHEAQFRDAVSVFDDYASRNPDRLVTIMTPGDLTGITVLPHDAPRMIHAAAA